MFGRKKSRESQVRELAIRMLVTQGALVDLDTRDAEKVVDYMQPRRFEAGTVLIREGETGPDQSMALILSGEVAVESVSPSDQIMVSVLGPGCLFGELALLDNAARSATCTAATDLALAVLTRENLSRLVDEEPQVAARLLLEMSKRIADRLRETNRKLLALTRVSKAMEQELDATHSVNRRLVKHLEAFELKRDDAGDASVGSDQDTTRPGVL